MSENLTPKHLRCGVAQCPSVRKLENGDFLIVGRLAEWEASEAGADWSAYEAPIVVSVELLSGLKDLVQATAETDEPQCDQLHADFEARAKEIGARLFGRGLVDSRLEADIVAALASVDKAGYARGRGDATR